jgi:hypothetical protein
MEEQKSNLYRAYEILESMEGGIKDVRERLAAEQVTPDDAQLRFGYACDSALCDAHRWIGQMQQDLVGLEAACFGRSTQLAAMYRFTRDKRLLNVRALLVVLGLRFRESKTILEKFVADNIDGVEAEV